jgi:hypothetical protein
VGNGSDYCRTNTAPSDAPAITAEPRNRFEDTLELFSTVVRLTT